MFFLIYLQVRSSFNSRKIFRTTAGRKRITQQAKKTLDYKPLGIAALLTDLTTTVNNTVHESLRPAGLLWNTASMLNKVQGQSDIVDAVILPLPLTSLISHVSPNTVAKNQCSQPPDDSFQTSDLIKYLHLPPVTLTSLSSRAHLHIIVSQKQNYDIWANEYLDLSTLQEEDVEDFSFNICTGAVSSTTASKQNLILLSCGLMLLKSIRQSVGSNTKSRFRVCLLIKGK